MKKDGCPDGNAAKPSSRNRLSDYWQMVEATSASASKLREFPSPPTIFLGIAPRLGTQRARKSGRGLRIMSFRPDVMKRVTASPQQRPRTPACASHSPLRHRAPWMRRSSCEATMRPIVSAIIVAAGATRLTTTTAGIDTISDEAGYAIAGSARENGRWKPLT